MTSDAQKRAAAKYEAESVRTVKVKLYPKDAELYDWMTENGYRGSWLADLARREFEKATSEEK